MFVRIAQCIFFRLSVYITTTGPVRLGLSPVRSDVLTCRVNMTYRVDDCGSRSAVEELFGHIYHFFVIVTCHCQNHPGRHVQFRLIISRNFRIQFDHIFRVTQ